MGHLYLLPLWSILFITTSIILIASELGFRLGKFHRSRRDSDKAPPIASMIQITLGLVAFIVAFTFGMAASHFNDRRHLVVDEANAIGTTFLRADFLPESDRIEVRNLLRQYVDIRINLEDQFRGMHKESDIELLEEYIGNSNVIQDKLWARAAAVGNARPESETVGLFISTLNDTIDTQTKRVTAAMHARLPSTIWLTLCAMLFLGMMGIGYQFGDHGQRNWTATVIVILSFSMVFTMIFDLDRATEGNLRSNQRPIQDLRKTMGPMETVREIPNP